MVCRQTVWLGLLLTILHSGISFAGSVVVSWAPNSDPGVLGYRVHYGTASHVYTTTIDVGYITRYEITNLNNGTKYYVAVSAYSEAGEESQVSEEGSAVPGAGLATDEDLPDGLIWYFAEGATGDAIDTYILVVNSSDEVADTRFTFLRDDGEVVTELQQVGPRSRYTLPVDEVPGLEHAAVSTVVESTNGVPIVAERAMYWGPLWQGGHNSAGVAAPSPTWFFAEGATGMFDEYLLIANPNVTPVDVNVTYLLPDGGSFTERHTVAATSRYNIYVNHVPGLAETAVSAVIETSNNRPVIAERAMYWGPDWIDGHNSPGVIKAAPEWFLAEGDTQFADTYILVANPSSQATWVRLTFLRIEHDPYVYDVLVPATSRTTVEVDSLPGMGKEAFGTVVTSLEGVAIVVERAMYWGPSWHGGHNTTGSKFIAEKWYLAEGATGGVLGFAELILVANPSPLDTTVRVSFMGADGFSLEREFALPADRRLTIDVNKLFIHRSASATVESTNGVGIVVERSMYWGALRYGGHNTMGVALK